MEYGVAQALLRAGFDVFGCDVFGCDGDADRVARLASEGGQVAPVAQAAGQSHILVSVVLNAAQTDTVLCGTDGAAGAMQAGSVNVSCATLAPDVARDMAARAAARGLHYLDAPISGGAAKAAAGQLSIMASARPPRSTPLRPRSMRWRRRCTGWGTTRARGRP